MSAYLIVDIDIVDPVGFEKYKSRVVTLVESYGGKYLVATDRIEPLEGDWKPKRIVVIEFPSMQRATEWFDCVEYHALSEIRHLTAKTKMILANSV